MSTNTPSEPLMSDEQIAKIVDVAWQLAEQETVSGDGSPETEWARYGEHVALATAASLEHQLAEARRDAERRHQLLILQHAESVELWNALKDLSFECDGVTRTEAPSRGTYNRAFAVLQSKLHLSPEALRGYASSCAAMSPPGMGDGEAA